MNSLKGGDYLLEALPHVVSALNRRLDVTFAGEDLPARRGRRRPRHWQDGSRGFGSSSRAGSIDTARVQALRGADFSCFPACGPTVRARRPRGCSHRLPVAAFAVGGIPDWLRPGVNGYLAPGDPPTPSGLADAIIACLKDPETHTRLRDGAGRVAAEFGLDHHVDALMRVLHDAAGIATERWHSEKTRRGS